MVLDEQNFPMFVLVKRIEIPARLGFYAYGDTQTAPLVKRLSELAVEFWQHAA